ncbi:hypothetical protein [Microvirga massiliensis]|uniref:hypothetical protein n=1 Tax=Microvirga massiliensis TaxID=1033741 RepID=UPI000AB3A0BD|nr:hypothetical protein [Microvirga massiliensis]
MFQKTILHTLLATVVMGTLALGYQASSQADRMADAISALTHLTGHGDHDRDDD